jgi:C4-dicarboxylate-specific signal transduction histidine kinase
MKKESAMIDTPHPGAAPNNTGTVLDFDVARSRTRAVGDWTASFTKLLGMAFREVDTDRERAKASIAKALSLVRVQIERSSFDPAIRKVNRQVRVEDGPHMGRGGAGAEQVEATLLIDRDLTDYTRASKALCEAQADLAHADRITTMGRLTASVAHEVKQPIATMVVHAQAARRFLDHRPPDLQEVRQALDCIVKDGYRVGDVIDRIRGLIKKAPPKKERVEINEAINDVLELTRGGAIKNGVSVLTEFAKRLPAVQADRVQLQQVILNLIINAVEAMSSMREGARELLICTEKAESGGVLVAVRDSGPGLTPGTLEHAFEASYTTKPSGLGLGLWICRSIIEAHGGRLWVTANGARGAIFQFTLPSAEKELMNSPQAVHRTGELHEDAGTRSAACQEGRWLSRRNASICAADFKPHLQSLKTIDDTKC